MENSKEIDLNKQNIERFEKLIASSKSMVFELEHEMAEVEVEHADLIMEIDKKRSYTKEKIKELNSQLKIITKEQPKDAETKSLEDWIDYKPSISLEFGIKKFAEWYLGFYKNNT